MATLYHSSLSFSYASPMEECSFSSSHRHHCHMQAPTRKGTRVRTLPTHSTISRKQTHFGKFLCKLPDNTPAVVTQSSWNESILKSDIPVIVEFWASWCGPCRMVHPVIDEIAEEYAGRIKCFKLNTDYNPQVASDYDIHSIPTVLLFKNGEKRESMTGTMPKSVYVAAIERSLALKDV